EDAFHVRLWIRRETFEVRERRAVADEDAVQLRVVRKPVQALHESRAERLARGRQRSREESLRALRSFGLFAEPAVGVATDASDRRQALEHLCGLERPRPERGG